MLILNNLSKSCGVMYSLSRIIVMSTGSSFIKSIVTGLAGTWY